VDFTHRLALIEELKSLPWPAVWDYYCIQKNVPAGIEWLTATRRYEKDVLSRRDNAVFA
jgi:L-rhamnose isomerase